MNGSSKFEVRNSKELRRAKTEGAVQRRSEDGYCLGSLGVRPGRIARIPGSPWLPKAVEDYRTPRRVALSAALRAMDDCFGRSGYAQEVRAAEFGFRNPDFIRISGVGIRICARRAEGFA